MKRYLITKLPSGAYTATPLRGESSPFIKGDAFRLLELEEGVPTEEQMGAAFTVTPAESKPLVVRLQEILAQQSPEVRAQFLPMAAGVEFALRSGDVAAAKLSIEGAEIPEELEPKRALLLAEFP